MSDDVKHLLWTGGWDSTYRLLNLILVHKMKVQPYYLIDTNRESTGLELIAMGNIKSKLSSKHPNERELLLPTYFQEVADIQGNHEITKCHGRLLMRTRIGSQYDWLARYASERKLKNLEMCAVNREGPFQSLICKYLNPSSRSIGNSPTSDRSNESYDVYMLFKYFRFPTIHLSKDDMLKKSKEYNYFSLMKLTTFCHRPNRKGKPCGVCNPCKIAIDEGFGWRLSYYSRAMYVVDIIKTKARGSIKNRIPGLYNFAKQVKHKVYR